MLYGSTLWFSLPEAPELVSQCLWQNCAYSEHCSDGPLWACHFLICFRPSGALVWDKSSRIGRMVALRYRQLGFQPRGSVVWLLGLPQLMYLKLIRCVYISSSEYILEFKVVKMFRNLKLYGWYLLQQREWGWNGALGEACVVSALRRSFAWLAAGHFTGAAWDISPAQPLPIFHFPSGGCQIIMPSCKLSTKTCSFAPKYVFQYVKLQQNKVFFAPNYLNITKMLKNQI